MKKAAVVIFSGGQDSTTCLAWATRHFEQIYAITFDYGQRHRIELVAAKVICNNFPLKVILSHKVVSLAETLKEMVASGLLNQSSQDETQINTTREDGLPDSFVPNRNQLFITIAHAYAQRVGASHVILGANQLDYSGYPDCRREFINAIESTTNLGSGAKIKLLTPLINFTKTQIFAMADHLGILPLIINHTMTCYNGMTAMNPWGMGCGKCNACLLRKQGYEEYIANQPVEIPDCLLCVWFRGLRTKGDGGSCAAYPYRIPDEIFTNAVPHIAIRADQVNDYIYTHDE